ncbi:30S ribosomal protein S21 [Candidatus Azambacteria bacterium]|nr:30S ribosomal protein S21 [Candidatus Azambacteria bacterium]MBI3685296.1 30S ribosomal protein S21 [Candidatus Azambacteria bacterium]
MIEAKRKEGETAAAFLRRFTKKIQQSGILIRARRTRFKTDKKNKREKQLAAMRRVTSLKERVRLFKLGKLDEWGQEKK